MGGDGSSLERPRYKSPQGRPVAIAYKRTQFRAINGKHELSDELRRTIDVMIKSVQFILRVLHNLEE